MKIFFSEAQILKLLFVLLLLPVFLPLFFWGRYIVGHPVTFQSLYGNILIFQGIVVIAVFVWLLYIVKVGKIILPISRSFLFIIILMLIITTASLFSLDPQESFIGSTSRGDRLSFLFHLGIYMWLLYIVLHKQVYGELYLKGAIIGGVLTTLLLIFSIILSSNSAGIDFINLDVRQIHLFGNPNFLAHYVLILSLAVSYFILIRKSLFYHWVAYVLFAWMIYVTDSTAAQILFIMLSIFVFWYRVTPLWRIVDLRAIMSAYVLLVVLMQIVIFNRWYFIPGLIERITAWKGALIALQRYGFFHGFGWGNDLIVWSYLPHDYFSFLPESFYEGVFDNMHNLFVEYVMSGGIAALIMVCIILVYMGYLSYRNWHHTHNVIWLWFCMVVVINMLFLSVSFNTLMSYILLGFLYIWFSRMHKDPEVTIAIKRFQGIFVAMVACMSVFVLYVYTFRPLVGIFHLEKALDYITLIPRSSEDIKEIFTLLQKAHKQSIAHDPLLWINVKAMENFIEQIILTQSEQDKAYQLLTSLYQRLQKRHPYNPHIFYYNGVAAARLHRFKEAFYYVERAHNLSPTNPLFTFSLVSLYVTLGDDIHALQLLTELQKNNIGAGKVALYKGILMLPDLIKARPELEKSFARYIPTQAEWILLDQRLRRLNNSVQEREFYEQILPLLQNNVFIYAQIIVRAQESGDKMLAEYYFKVAQRNIPNKMRELNLMIQR